MAKILPPLLEGSLPAFCLSYEENEKGEMLVDEKTGKPHVIGANLNIPFSLGRAVSINEIVGISLRVRTIATNTWLIDSKTTIFNLTDSNIAYFTLTEEQASKLNVGQYYRIQLAFIGKPTGSSSEEEIGYYSTVGIIKCVARPSLKFGNNFKLNKVNVFTTDVIGVYEQNVYFGDTTEKVYSYNFVLYNEKEEAIAESGEKLHDTTQDVASEWSQDHFKILTELEEGEIGSIVYTVTTLNGLTISSPAYSIMKVESVQLEYPLKIFTRNNFDDGCIELTLKGDYTHGYIGEADLPGTGEEAVYSGTFVITRADERSDYKEWIEISRFIIAGDYASHYGFRDFTVEQGVKYRYGIQQYNVNYVYSEKVLSRDLTPWMDRKDPMYWAQEEPVQADFEDMFLFDGQRQLKIRYNPKMTSFKNSIPEQKIDTIGSKYPFIFRNAHTKYKDFPIGGLLSFQADDQGLFLFDRELQDSHILTTDLSRVKSRPYGPTWRLDSDGKVKLESHTATWEWMAHEQNYWVNQVEEVDPYTKKVVKKNEYIPYTDAEKNQPLKETLSYERVQFTSPDGLERHTVKIKSNHKTLKGVVFFDPVLETVVADSDEALAYVTKEQSFIDINGKKRTNLDGTMVRQNKDLTSDNILSERFFKLTALDWLGDGNVKLFRSPTEGNYLVRILNTQLQPVEQLGRMIHNFTCQAYEIDNISYEKLVYYHIMNNDTPIITSLLWAGVDVSDTLRLMAFFRTITEEQYQRFQGDESYSDYILQTNFSKYSRQPNNQDTTFLEWVSNKDTFVEINFEEHKPLSIFFDDFMPEDIVRLTYAEEVDPQEYYIGITGNLFFDFNEENRTIIKVEVQASRQSGKLYDPVEYSRLISYSYIGLATSRFDAIFGIDMDIPIGEEFVGPKENLLNPYNLLPDADEYKYGEEFQLAELLMKDRIIKSLLNSTSINYQLGPYADKFKLLSLEHFKARRREVIPIYACDNLYWNDDSQQFEVKENGEFEYDSLHHITDINSPGTLFSITPFGIGYVAHRLIYEIDNENQSVYTANPNIFSDEINTLDITPLEVKQIENKLPELIGYHYDGWCILKVYIPKVEVIDGEIKPAVIHKTYFDLLDGWQENPDRNYLYYDTYTHKWWPPDWEYDPTFSITTIPEYNSEIPYDDIPEDGFVLLSTLSNEIIDHIEERESDSKIQPYYPSPQESYWAVDTTNMDKIDLTEIGEIELKNLKNPDVIRLGTGVMAEITPRLQIVEYSVEEKMNEVYTYKQQYLAEKEEYFDKLKSAYGDSYEIAKKIRNYKDLTDQINSFQDQINGYNNAIEETINLGEALVNRLIKIDVKMYELQNSILDTIYDMIKDMEIPTALDNSGVPYKLVSNDFKDLYENHYVGITAYGNNIYQRNYYYNDKLKSFYYQPNPTEIENSNNLFAPSDMLNFSYVEGTDSSGHAYANWVAGSKNGIYTLYSDNTSVSGDVYYNQMLEEFKKVIITNQLPEPNDDKTVYEMVQSINSEIGNIPGWVHTYGQFRQWIKILINEKALLAYDMLHYYNTLPEDVERAYFKDENNQYKLTVEGNNWTIDKHPLYDISYLEDAPNEKLLYVVLSGNMNQVKNYSGLTNRQSYDSTYRTSYTSAAGLRSASVAMNNFEVNSITFQGNYVYYYNENTAQIIDQANDDALALINTYDLQPSELKYSCDVYYDIEYDYYYQPIWLNNSNNLKCGFYKVYCFTELGLTKVMKINNYTSYAKLLNEFLSGQWDNLTDNQKSEKVLSINNLFLELFNTYNSNINIISKLKPCACHLGTEEEPQIDTYSNRIKIYKDYYYDEYGLIKFHENVREKFEDPKSLLKVNYDGSKNLWEYFNGTLVDYFIEEDEEGQPITTVQNFAKNTALDYYYQWCEHCKSLDSLYKRFEDWTEGRFLIGGIYSGLNLEEVEFDEKAAQEMNKLLTITRNQARAATIILKTETSTGTLSQKRYNELIDLIAELIQEIGLSELQYINDCRLNLDHTIDATILETLKTKYKNLFDQEDIMIEEINQIFRDNSYRPGIGEIVDSFGNIYEYKTFPFDFLDTDGTTYLPNPEADNIRLTPEIKLLVNQLSQRIDKYVAENSNKLKYQVRAKLAVITDTDKAAILQLRDSFYKEIDELTQQTIILYNSYDAAWIKYVQAVGQYSNLFWSENGEDPGINMLLLRYQSTLDKNDTEPFNDEDVNGRIQDYLTAYKKFQTLYYAVKLHNKDEYPETAYSGENYNLVPKYYYKTKDIADNIVMSEDSLTLEDIEKQGKDIWLDENGLPVQDPVLAPYIVDNADKLFDDFSINYEILMSLNEIQSRYADQIAQLSESKAKLELARTELGTWTDADLQNLINEEKEIEDIYDALASYLAALGYRYYQEVEVFYKQ